MTSSATRSPAATRSSTTTDPVEPDRLYDAANALLAAVVDYYTTNDEDSLPGRRYVSPGPPAWDLCEKGCDGQLATYLDRTYNFDGAGESSEIVDRLNVRAGEFLVEIAVPVATLDDGGTPPAATIIDDDAFRVLRHAALIQNAVVAAYRAGDLAGCHGLAVLGWEGLGPDGAMAGGRLRVRWRLTA